MSLPDAILLANIHTLYSHFMPSIPRPHVLQDVQVRTKARVDNSVDAEDRRASLEGLRYHVGLPKKGANSAPNEVGANERPER